MRVRVTKANLKGQLAGYIAFREMSADYANKLADLKPDELVKAQESWREQLKKFVILPNPFSIAAEELTVSLKMRRNIILDHHNQEIEELYRK